MYCWGHERLFHEVMRFLVLTALFYESWLHPHTNTHTHTHTKTPLKESLLQISGYKHIKQDEDGKFDYKTMTSHFALLYTLTKY